MDSKEESEIPHMPLHRGPNPFIDKERCLLCGCPRPDPPEADRIRAGECPDTCRSFPWEQPNCSNLVKSKIGT